MPPSTTSRSDSRSASSDAKGHDIRGHPEGTPAEHGHTVHRDPECAAVPIGLHGAEPDGPQFHVQAVGGEAHRVQRLGAVGVRPPSFGVGYPDDGVDASAALQYRHDGSLAMIPDVHLHLGPGVHSLEEQSDADHSARSLTGRDQVALRHERRAGVVQADGAPGPDGRSAGRPTRYPAEQSRAVPALVLGAQLQAPPAGTWPPFSQQRGQGSEAEQQDVVGVETVDRDLVGDPHVLRVEDGLAVEPCIGDRGQPVEFEAPGSLQRGFRSVEAAPVPPLAPVEQVLVDISPAPPTEFSQRSRRGAGHRRGDPRRVVGRHGRHIDIRARVVPPAFPRRSGQDVARDHVLRCRAHDAI